MAGTVSSAWFDLFEANKDSDAESSLESYDSLNKLDSIPGLSFLKDLIWEEIRTWVANNTDLLSVIRHQDLDGPGYVFLGGMNHALNDDTLREHNISAVISIHPQDLLAWHPTNASYGLRRFQISEPSCPVHYHLMIPLEDKSNADLLDYFDKTNEFLHSHLQEGRNVLVHCKSGRSRSVAVVIAYLQRKYYETTVRPQELQLDEALVKMASYREAVTESIRQQRLPVSIIMERFEALLELYDLQLLGHPAYERERAEGFASPPPLGRRETLSSQAASTRTTGSQSTADSQMLSSQTLGSDATSATATTNGSQSSGGRSRRRVKKKGGAAILKICTAVVFFKHGQKPPASVVERLFEVNEDYFYELEASGHKGVSYGESGHTHRGICAFYDSFADGFDYESPAAVSLLASEKRQEQPSE